MFGSKKRLCQKNLWVKKKYGLKNLWVKKIFGSKKILGQNFFWVNKYFGSKNVGSKRLGLKNFLIPVRQFAGDQELADMGFEMYSGPKLNRFGIRILLHQTQ